MRSGSWCLAMRWALAAGGALLTAGAGLARAGEPPIVPGYTRLKDANAKPAELGQVLLGELNCAQCHAAPEARRILTKGAPDLSDAGARMTPQYLRAYILNPHAMKPGATMPDLFHASDPHAKEGAADFLTAYLVSLGGPIKPSDEDGNTLLVEQGRKLYQSVGCVACHAIEKGAASKVPSVPLPNLAEKTTVDHLEAFLQDPLKERPASRMPNLGLSKSEAHAIAIYLLRDQLTNPQVAKGEPAKLPGVKFDYYQHKVANAAIENVGRSKPKATGRIDRFTADIPGHRENNFAVKFTGILTIPKPGKYTFFTTSDDGSRLYIDAREIVENDGVHPASEKQGEVELTAGGHPIIVTYYQEAGESSLKVEWSGPGLQRQEIPPAALHYAGQRPMVPLNSASYSVDPLKAQIGGRMFAAMGCASCHQIKGEESMRKAKALADLNANEDTGCLGTHVARGLPNYDLNDDQRAALKTALADRAGLDKPFEPKEQVVHTMAAVNCFACHNRDGVGGPTAERAEFFKMTAEFDMGDEGKIPPPLTGAGGKLLASAMEAIIFDGKLHIRPVLATRMPMWGKPALGSLVDAFQKADSTSASDTKPPEFNAQSAQDGRLLLGVKGLGCINCHGVEGIKSLGMPAPDLTLVHDRLKYGWYKAWMDNPPALKVGTRMPQFWTGHEIPVNVKDVGGGTEDGQEAALWDYLSMGQSMMLPVGLQPGGFELVPADSPLIHRTFMAGVGPRAVLVGFPEGVHVAFDANGVKLAEAWRGKFFDAGGMWDGRGGRWNGPLGHDILPMPPGPAFALLEHGDSPWPQLEMGRSDEKFRNVGGHFKGYVLDKNERPTFHYILNDTIDIQEQPLPVLKSAKPNLDRKFTVSSKEAVKGLYFLAAQGKKIDQKTPGVWAIDDGKTTVTLTAKDATLEPVVRDSNGQKQLLVPIEFTSGTISFDEEIAW
jgi:mono/diheme cytochrome c family protein